MDALVESEMEQIETDDYDLAAESNELRGKEVRVIDVEDEGDDEQRLLSRDLTFSDTSSKS